MQAEQFFKVAVEAPLFTALTYRGLEAWQPGQSVIVPLGKRRAQAVVLGLGEPGGEYTIKDIEGANTERPALSPPYLRWLEWLADYYVHPIGMVTSLAFPPLATKTSKRVSKKKPVVQTVTQRPPPTLTSEQAKTVEGVLATPKFYPHLVHGVTGSGKTEIYMRLLEEILQRGQRGLVLVPEIALTPQLIERFASRFGDQIAAIHSHLTDRERTNQWWAMVSGEKKILIGARSALFCPVPDLGIIIVDEEHEASYKQEEKLRYNARDAAVVLARFLDVPIVLGSATPSLESWQNAQSGKYKLHTLRSRVEDRALPTVEVVDLRLAKEAKRENYREDLPHWMSESLHAAVHATLAKEEQVALFLNRRGIAQTVLCGDCGYIAKCPNCAISLTLHGRHDLVCHYCDYHMAFTPTCPSCKVGEPKALGLGTEQIEEDMKKLFPEARVSRADRDEIHSRESLEELIENMENHKIDILVGTQMIAKGLDFPKLTLVGLVMADVGFNIPDFRATERSFQLLTQMSGRAGRHLATGGQVIVQTYNPEYPSLPFARTADYEGFAAAELQLRQELLYPPFGRLAALRITASHADIGQQTSERLAHRGHKLREQNPRYADIQILGPSEAPLAKLRGKYRFHLLLKTTKPQILSAFCRQLLGDGDWIPGGTKVQVDIDPLNLL